MARIWCHSFVIISRKLKCEGAREWRILQTPNILFFSLDQCGVQHRLQHGSGSCSWLGPASVTPTSTYPHSVPPTRPPNTQQKYLRLITKIFQCTKMSTSSVDREWFISPETMQKILFHSFINMICSITLQDIFASLYCAECVTHWRLQTRSLQWCPASP